MSTLIYHPLTQAQGKVTSPFDDAILRVAATGAVRIVSPYISVSYLQRIIDVACEWQLVSDVQEWLRSCPIWQRARVWGFIRTHLARIHHCPDLHAKTVISTSLAMLGSANITSRGILGRTELGILLDDPALVAEAGVWFDSLWQQTSPPVIGEASAYVAWLDEEAKEARKAPARGQPVTLSGTSRKVRAKLATLPQLAPPPAAPAGAPLDLGQLAQAIVVAEQKRYDSVDAGIEDALTALMPGPFTLKQIADKVKAGCLPAKVRDVYLLFVQLCANVPRSAFAESTQNRVTYTQGQFSESTREGVTEALKRYDCFLVTLIRQLDFVIARELPTEKWLEQQTGFLERDQIIMIAALEQCGLIDFEDVAGALPRYKLVSDFVWEGRFRLFQMALYAWQALKDKPNRTVSKEYVELAEELAEVSVSGVEVSQLLDTDEYEREQPPSATTLQRDQAQWQITHAQEQARLAQERHDKIDKVLSHILARLFRGDVLWAPKLDMLATRLSQETAVGQLLIRKLFGDNSPYPRVIGTMRRPEGGIQLTISDKLTWEAIEDYPLTRMVCAEFLDKA